MEARAGLLDPRLQIEEVTLRSGYAKNDPFPFQLVSLNKNVTI